jgi:hypothetical protein
MIDTLIENSLSNIISQFLKKIKKFKDSRVFQQKIDEIVQNLFDSFVQTGEYNLINDKVQDDLLDKIINECILGKYFKNDLTGIDNIISKYSPAKKALIKKFAIQILEGVKNIIISEFDAQQQTFLDEIESYIKNISNIFDMR